MTGQSNTSGDAKSEQSESRPLTQAEAASPTPASKQGQNDKPPAEIQEAPPAQADVAAPKAASKAGQKGDAREAKRAYELGLRAEATADWNAAFDAYSEAAENAPRDVEILRHKELARFRLVSAHTDAAERYAVAGKMSEAREELREALSLDPGYSVAQERLAQFSKPSFNPQAGQPALGQTDRAGPGLAGPVRLAPQPGLRSFDFRTDTRSAYAEVARQFGLTASFDADLASRRVQLKLSDVDFRTAMDVLAQQTNTFWRPVNEHLFFVAANSMEKRREYAEVVEREIELPDSITLEQMTEIQRVVREILGIGHSQLNLPAHNITVRDSPAKVKLAGELIRQVQQARGEVMLEIELLEVDRSTALALGLSPPTKAELLTVNQNDLAALRQAPDIAALLAVVQRILGRTSAFGGINSSQLGSLISGGALLPPVFAVGGGKSTILATVAKAAIDFSEEFNLLRSGRRMLLRASDGEPASFFIGDRFPVALALLSPSLGTPAFIPALSGTTLPRTDFPVGKAPVALVSADFNGDTFGDLAAANRDDNTISILLNDGNGAFRAALGSPVPLGTGKAPVALASGVFNENSARVDLLVVNKSSGDLTVLQNDGKGGFQQATGSPIKLGMSPTAIATGAFNSKKDGHLGLAVTNSQDNTVTILLGDGKGNFTPAPGSPIKLANNQQSPVAIVSKDFNADGAPDLAVVNQTTGNVAILLGKGDGTFTEAPGSPIATGKSPAAITAADFDGDARPDLAVVNQADNTASIFLGRGDGSFVAAPNPQIATGAGPAAVVSGDFNGDGRTDLIVADTSANSVSVFFGVGAGNFSQAIALPTGSNPAALVTASFTKNGRSDLAAADSGSNQVTVILNLLSNIPGNGGIAQQPFPGAEYLDLGLKVKATPRLHGNSEVSLHLEFEIRNLAGSALNGIPIISNRTIDQFVRVRENETTIISGMLERDEVRSLSGLPGLTQIPIGGVVAGKLQSRPRDTELIILVTPRQLRLMPTAGRALYAGRGDEPIQHGEGPTFGPQVPLPGAPGTVPPGTVPPGTVPPGTTPPSNPLDRPGRPGRPPFGPGPEQNPRPPE